MPPEQIGLMDRTSSRRTPLGLIWTTDDPVATAARLSDALDGEVAPFVACLIGGLALTVTTSAPGDRFDVLRAVGRDAGPAVGIPAVVAVGWATVDLDRAERQLVEAGVVPGPLIVAGAVEALGATSRRADDSAFDVPLVLLEPVTEGRLAATLARRGEGPCAIIVGAASVGLATLVPGGSTTGPHLLVDAGGYHRDR